MKPPLLTDAQKAQILGDTPKPLAQYAIRVYPPRQSISLWDMFRVFLPDVFPRWVEIANIAADYKEAAYTPAKAGRPLVPGDFVPLKKTVSNFQFVCSQLELTQTAYQVHLFEQTIDGEASTPLSIHVMLENLIRTTKKEMSERLFTRIPFGKDGYFEQDALFGPDVAKSFPEAAANIRAAGNCLAADLNTAAVFHLMCVANIGLIRIARRLRVIIKNIPLEFAEWQKMIEKIESKLKQKSISPGKNRNKKEKEAIRTFCNRMLVKINEFKDIRNTVCHARGNYSAKRALSVIEDVKEFMNELAAKLP